MKNKKMITGFAAALFCLLLVGASFALEYEGEGSEFGFALEKNVASSSQQLDPNANWLAMAELSNEASLEDTYDYQLNKDKYIHVNDGQVEVATPSQSKSDGHCAQVNKPQTGC